ncbi:MAG: hypothetical protein DRI65_16205 [Chloroflexota bacterium]|nr:MAG: hypothetical protein DRI65_16205 [Chloroflexota bacterium]
MRNSYKGYKQLSNEDFKHLWESALFVFDANVLLNLYRYQSSTRDNLLTVLEGLGDRIWIPYHVGLEFERNRLVVIADQKKRFSDVRKSVEKSKAGLIAELDNLQLRKRHSLINPDKLVIGYEKLTKEFLEELDELQKKQQDLTDFDPLREKLEHIFNEHVGSPPVDQEAIDKIHKDGEYRFNFNIPPGFQDNDKGNDEIDEFLSGGILYKRKYGDLIVWKQILDHAKSTNTKSLIFVTDDSKEDWWLKVNSDGPKTIGPRPELTDEITIEAGVDRFYMYNPEGFLKYSKELLHTEVSDDTIKEVRDISVSRSKVKDTQSFMRRSRSAKKAVYNWLTSQFEEVTINRDSFPNFIARSEDRKLGFDVKMMTNPKTLVHRLREMIYRSYFEIKENDFDEMVIVIVLSDVEDIEMATNYCVRLTENMPPKLRIIIGVGEVDSSGEVVDFVPYDDFSAKKC